MKPIGAACLVGMTGLTCVDVVGRFFRHPVFGSVELVTFMGIFVVAFALPYTHENKGHIGVEILVQRFSRKTRAVVDIVTGLVSFVFFALVTWRLFLYAFKMAESGEVSMNLELPEYVIIFVVALCFVVFSLIIIKDIIENIAILREK
ncbi:MAG: TRAP transporter small permease [Thermodesulfobacteriota bacterium]